MSDRDKETSSTVNRPPPIIPVPNSVSSPLSLSPSSRHPPAAVNNDHDRPNGDEGNDDEEIEQLESTIELINARLNKFENNLDTAIESETDFNNFVFKFTKSVDLFVMEHIEQDRRLTQLIDEDTVRTKKAKRQYDELLAQSYADLQNHCGSTNKGTTNRPSTNTSNKASYNNRNTNYNENKQRNHPPSQSSSSVAPASSAPASRRRNQNVVLKYVMSFLWVAIITPFYLLYNGVLKLLHLCGLLRAPALDAHHRTGRRSLSEAEQMRQLELRMTQNNRIPNERIEKIMRNNANMDQRQLEYALKYQEAKRSKLKQDSDGNGDDDASSIDRKDTMEKSGTSELLDGFEKPSRRISSLLAETEQAAFDDGELPLPSPLSSQKLQTNDATAGTGATVSQDDEDFEDANDSLEQGEERGTNREGGNGDRMAEGDEDELDDEELLSGWVIPNSHFLASRDSSGPATSSASRMDRERTRSQGRGRRRNYDGTQRSSGDLGSDGRNESYSSQGTFPSADFWKISCDDLKLDMMKDPGVACASLPEVSQSMLPSLSSGADAD